MRPEEVAAQFGPYASPTADEIDRPALVAALMSELSEADAALVRALTRLEMDYVDEKELGCGDVLLACCWLLFRLGHIEDSALVFEVKMLSFDASCAIDTALLIPHGIAATAAYARELGDDDLREWVEAPEHGDLSPTVEAWRRGGYYFGDVLAASSDVADLGSWLRG